MFNCFRRKTETMTHHLNFILAEKPRKGLIFYNNQNYYLNMLHNQIKENKGVIFSYLEKTEILKPPKKKFGVNRCDNKKTFNYFWW